MVFIKEGSMHACMCVCVDDSLQKWNSLLIFYTWLFRRSRRRFRDCSMDFSISDFLSCSVSNRRSKCSLARRSASWPFSFNKREKIRPVISLCKAFFSYISPPMYTCTQSIRMYVKVPCQCIISIISLLSSIMWFMVILLVFHPYTTVTTLFCCIQLGLKLWFDRR